MWSSRASAAAYGLLLAGMVLSCWLAVTAQAQVQLPPSAQQTTHRMRRSLLAQALVCDGQIHELSMPDTPYPDTIPYAPIVSQPFFACTRPKQGLDAESNGECGAQPRYECENHVYEPVLLGSGQTPGIISPNNPVTVSLKDESDFYLTYVEWTAVDVGTAGARLRGVYSASSDLSPVTANYAWSWNGRNAMGEFGPCSSCKVGQGIRSMNVSAIPGAGFRSMQLSQMFVNTQCAGGAGVNYDGLYWHGMKYACVRPTCGDTDLDTADAQRFSGCSPSTSYQYNPKAENNTIISVESCCMPITCDNVSPVRAPGQSFSCPENREFDPTKASIKGPSITNCCSKPATCDDVQPISAPGAKYQCPQDTHQYNPSQNKITPPTKKACCMPRTCANLNPITNPGERFACPKDTEFNPATENSTKPDAATCCKPATCADVTPITKPGVKYSCPGFREFDPKKADAENPSDKRCCSKVAHCSDVSPIKKPGTRFQCPEDMEYTPMRGLMEEPNADKCCQAATCANVSPVQRPGTAFECPVHTEFNPERNETFPPRAKHCCKKATCANVHPISQPGVKYECPVLTEFKPEEAETHPPSLGACCKVATCEDINPISNPGRKYRCPAGTEYNPKAGVKADPSMAVCCVPATCSNISPMTKPGVNYTCPGNRQFDPEKRDNVMPSDENCCSKENSCDDINPITSPGVKFECPAFRQFDPAKAKVSWPSEERCCSKIAHCSDIFPITAAGTKFACPMDSEYNPTAALEQFPNEAKCCKKATCGNMQPVSKFGVKFACPDLTEFDPSRTATFPPRPESCCKPATCADVKPISKIGTKFVCPSDREYDPANWNKTQPTIESCCSKVATCADTAPISSPDKAFVCPNNREFDPARRASAPVSEKTCCSKAFTCGAIKPVSRPGVGFNCAPFREFDPSKNYTEKPNEANCCSKPKTCGDFFPVSSPNTPFPCSNASEYNPAMSEAWPPSEAICCRPASCSDIKPVSNPGERFACPKFTEYDEAKDSELDPALDTCCRAATCSDLHPISKPGVKFVCPANTKYNTEASAATQPGELTCCQSLVDVFVKKSVSPGNTQRAGSILLYRVEVGLPAAAKKPAATVTMVDAMPEGMSLVAVVEEPDEGVCQHDEAGITCIWQQIAPGDVKMVTITANASVAGVQPSIAAVTTASLDTDPNNNKASVSVNILGACCTAGPDGGHQCSEMLPEACTGGFLPQSTCSQVDICSAAAFQPAGGDDAGVASEELFQIASVGPKSLTDMINLAAAKLGTGACCVDSTCTDGLADSDCAGTWSEGLSCSDSRVMCGGDTFQIAAISEQVSLPKGLKQPHPVLQLGSCCVDGACTEVPDSDCAGIWTDGGKCSSTECAKADEASMGACCDPLSGACSDGVLEDVCAAPAKWTKDGKCQPNGVCTGACCNGGKCSQQLKKDCPGEWTLYKDCKLDTCPKPAGGLIPASADDPPICIPKWQQCGKGKKDKEKNKEKGSSSLFGLFAVQEKGHSMDNDKDKPNRECCEGTTCQYTYEGCKAGRFVCKPKEKCVHKEEPCGGQYGGQCCKGLTCVWDYTSRSGTCRKVDRCIKEGGKCQDDSQCCRGTRCKGGECSAPICWKRCSDFKCYVQRKKDCDAMQAAAASA